MTRNTLYVTVDTPAIEALQKMVQDIYGLLLIQLHIQEKK